MQVQVACATQDLRTRQRCIHLLNSHGCGLYLEPAELTMEFRFEVLKTDPTGARLGRLTTPHGVVDTPAFMPVGTAGTVKGLTQQALGELGVQILLGNTYHLYLRPGHETIRRLGGLHRFMSWPGA